MPGAQALYCIVRNDVIAIVTLYYVQVVISFLAVGLLCVAVVLCY